jgi:hypothetical protein
MGFTPTHAQPRSLPIDAACVSVAYRVRALSRRGAAWFPFRGDFHSPPMDYQGGKCNFNKVQNKVDKLKYYQYMVLCGNIRATSSVVCDTKVV